MYGSYDNLLFRFFAALFWSSWFIWASYSFLLELLGEQQELSQNRPSVPLRKGWESPAHGDRASGLGCCDKIPCLWEMEKNPSGWTIPSFQDPLPFTPVPCYLVCLGERWLSQVWRGKGMWFPWLFTVCRPPHHTPRLVLLDLPSVVKRNETTQTASYCLGQGFGSPSSEHGVYKMSFHCVVSQVSLLSVFSFLFSEFYGYLFKFQSVVSCSMDQYEKNECMPLSGPRLFLNPLLFIFFFRLPNLS